MLELAKYRCLSLEPNLVFAMGCSECEALELWSSATVAQLLFLMKPTDAVYFSRSWTLD